MVSQNDDRVPIQKWPSCADLPRACIASTRPATLGVVCCPHFLFIQLLLFSHLKPLTRSYSMSISAPANLAYALGQYAPMNDGAWANYYYRSPNYRSGWPYAMWRNRFMVHPSPLTPPKYNFVYYKV
jgi:hypothetical protein